MKKLIILMLILLVGKFSFGQYPIPQNIGSDSTLVSVGRNFMGGLKGNLIVMSYADTTAANLIRVKAYAGAVIFTTGANKLWYRNAAASAWIELGSSAGGVNIYNSDGTLTGTRTLDGGGFGLAFNGLENMSIVTSTQMSFQSGSSAQTQVYFDQDSIRMTSGSQRFHIKGDTGSFSKRVSYTTNLGSTFTRHTLVDKNYVDSLQNIIPTLQQVLTAGSILTTNNTINYGGNDFKLRGDSIVLLAADGTERLRLIPVDDGAPGGASQITFINADEAKMTIQSGDQYLETTTGWFIRNTVGVNSSLSVNGSSLSGSSPQVAPLVEVIQGAETLFELSNDSFSSRPPFGKMYIDSLRTTSDTSVYKPLVWSPDNKSVRKFDYWPGGSGGGGGAALSDTAAAIRSDFPNTYADLTTSIVDEDGFYNGFPWPVQKEDTTIVFLKHSTTHADTGSMRYYKSWNGGRSWSSGADVYIGGRRIPNSALQVGYNNNRIQIAWTEDTYDSVLFAYSDNGGASWTSAGGYQYSSNWTGSPSIQEIFTIQSDTLYSAQYELDNDSDSSRAFLLYSADNGASWSYLREVLLHTGTTFPNGRTSEWFMVQTTAGDFDNTTQFAALFRNESYGYYTHVRTANLFQTKTEDVTNLMYEFGNQVQRAPVCMFNMQQTIYILCGNRRSNNLFALEYVTIPAASFYTNTQSAYSKVRKLYAASAATKAAAEDFGYPLFYVYNQKPYVTMYDVSPVYHSSGEGSDDDVRSINFPLLDRGYSEKFNDANQSITDSTQTLVSYPDLLLDCMGSWDYDGDAGTTDTVWEAKEDGWYMVNAIATFEANGTGSYRQMYVIVVDPGVNTTATNQMISKTTIPGNSSIADFNRVECNGMAYIKQGEQVKVYVKHDATSALNLLNTSRETMATVKITLVR